MRVTEKPNFAFYSFTGLQAKEVSTRAVAAACMLAVSPATLALAQSAQNSSELPPIVVQGQKAKAKKPVAAKKAAPPKQKQASPTPQPPSDEAAEPVANATADGAARPGGNPYANPDAPYKVERSGSGKLTEPLVNTPKTVTAIPKEVIQDKGATTVRELARQTPGVVINFAEGGNSFNGAYSVRGFSARNDTFVDNLRDPGYALRDVFSIEQVEIYKGPSGSIGGRSTIGGAINFITKQPDLNMSHYETTGTVGTDETVRTTLDVNQVVNPNFAVRTNLMYNQNEVAGRDFTDNERWGGFISATGKLSDSVKVTLDFYHLDSDGTPDWGVPINRAKKIPFTETGLPRDTWYGQKSLDFMKDRSDVGSATVVAKLTDGITLTNRTRVGQTSTDYVATAPRPVAGQDDLNDPLTINNPARDQTVDLLANQTELNFKFRTGSLKHEVLAGVEVSREEIERLSYTFTGGTVLPNLGNPNPYRNTRSIAGKGFTYDATVDTVGGYISDTVHLTDQWIVNGGLRVDDFERDQRGLTAATTGNVQDTLFSWHTGIVFKPIPIASIYAAYSTAESPVGSELDSTDPRYNGISNANSLTAKPQEARSIEVGTKWELFDRRLLATAALFQTDVDNARTGSQDPDDDDVGEYRIRGVELGVSGNLTDRWSVFGGLVVLETEVFNAGTPTGANNLRQTGDELANIPEAQFALLSKYKLTDQLTVGGQAIYASELHNGFFARAVAPENYSTVDWWRFDAFVEYQLTKNIELELSGINLTDELYYDALYQQNNSFVFVAPGRAGYLTLKYKY